MRSLLLLVLALLATPAAAGERSYQITSFDRIRVEGPFDVRLSVGGAPSARAEGETGLVDGLDLRVDGMTLVVRATANVWGERPRGYAGHPPVVNLSTPTLRVASVTGGGRLAIDRLRAMRADLSVNGAGSLKIDAIDADQVYAVLTGNGAVTLGGKAQRAQLLTNGTGAIDAGALEVGDLTVAMEGSGETHARAKFTARVTNMGLGSVTVDGTPTCKVTAPAGGVVSCGAK